MNSETPDMATAAVSGDEVQPTYGLLAEFDSPASLMHACEQVRDAGYQKWDAHTPFPVHGLDKAMGLKRSKVPLLAFAGAMVGAAAGMGLQWWTSTIDYPLVIAGKPLFSWQAYVPVTFELAVWFGALGAIGGMLHFNKLPRLYHFLFRSKRFERVTDDAFFISIEAADPSFDAEGTRQFLAEIGARHIEAVEE